MSQNIYNFIDSSIVGGTELATILNDFKNAVVSGFCGPTRPTNLQANGYWIDDSQKVSNNLLFFKLYTGTADVTIFTINASTNTATIPGTDNAFEIVRISEDTVGAVLTTTKKRVTASGAVKNGDNVGLWEVKAVVSGGTTLTVGRIRYVANEDLTGSSAGGYWAFEGTTTGQATPAEWARMVAGRLGLGVTAPAAALHVRSTTGIKNERVDDSTTAAKDVLRKGRVSGGGQVLSGDEIGHRDFNSTDNAGTEFTGARIVATADENHTATNRGTKVAIQAVKKGTNTLADVVEFAEGKMDTKGSTISMDGLEKKVQTFASVAESLALDAQKAFVEVTGTTAMVLKGISATSASKSFYLYNATNQNIIIANQAADATAANRIAVNGETSMTLQPGKSVEFVYRSSISRWSPLVEGNTGITYNEATELLAKLVAKSWNGEPITDVFKDPPELTGYWPWPTIVRTTPQFMVALEARPGSIKAALAAKGFQWILNTDLNSDFGTGGPSSSWDRGYLIDNGVGFTGRFVRPVGTQRSILATRNPGTGVIAFASGGLDNAVSWRDVATDGTNNVAVASAGAYRAGRNTGVLTTWTYTNTATIDVPLYSVAYGAGKFVAVGGVVPGGSPNHAAWVSSDNGATWASYAVAGLNEATDIMYLVRYVNNQFVAVGGPNMTTLSIFTSPDGQTWTQRFTVPGGVSVKDIAFGGGLYIVVTDTTKAVISLDGINWLYVDAPAIGSVTWNGEKFVGVRTVSPGPEIIKSLSPNF